MMPTSPVSVRALRTASATVLTVCLVAGAAAAADSAPAQVIRTLHDTYKAVLTQAATLRYEGRYQKLAPAISQAFDFAFMARAVIGREWNDLPADQQTRWIQTFRNFTIANYAAQMDHDAGQVFEILGEQPGENDTTMVLSRVVEPKAETVNLNYRLRQTPDGWKIIDIYAKGTVSELALRRSEYTTVLKTSGIDALVALVDRKVADLAAGKKVQ